MINLSAYLHLGDLTATSQVLIHTNANILDACLQDQGHGFGSQHASLKGKVHYAIYDSFTNADPPAPPAELLELDLVTNLTEGLCGSMWTTRVEFDHVGLDSAAVELPAGSLFFHFLVLWVSEQVENICVAEKT